MTIRTRLILIPAHAADPASFLVFDDAGVVLERGRLALGDAAPPPVSRTVAVAPGAEVLVRWLDLPAGGPAQQRTAALWALKDELAVRPERLSASLGPTTPPGEPRLAAVVDSALLKTWRDYLAALGVTPAVILPDSLVPTLPADPDAAHVMVLGADAAVRAHGLAATVQTDLVEALIGSRRRIDIHAPEEVERQFIETARRPPVNLLDDGRAEAAGRRRWLRAAVLAGLVVLSPLMLTVAQAVRDDMAAGRADREARALAVRADPDLAGSDDPAADLIERLEGAPPPGGLVNAAAALALALEGVPGGAMESLTLETGGGLRAGLAYPAFEDLEAIRRSVTAAGLSLTELSTVEDGDRIVSDVAVEAAR